MTKNIYDVVTIGNAIVDVLSLTEDAFLESEGMVKGSMKLITSAEAEDLYERMGPAQLISGGCAGNSAAGIASMGGNAAFIGKVAADELGHFYRHDMISAGIGFPTEDLQDGAATGRSMILITPDTERTMNTYLGACQELSPDDIDVATIEGAAITYMEGFLWDPPKAKEAFRAASKIAHDAHRRVAITLSDSFCVDRYREEFIELMRSGAVDIVFANHHEALALYETEDFETAKSMMGQDVDLAVITLGPDGSVVLSDGKEIHVAAPPVPEIIDKTGAGDLYAAGFLFGHARNMPLKRCAELGSLAAGEILSHVGARPQHKLSDLAAEKGLI